MTILYKGIRRKTTDVLTDYGQAHYAQNWRFKRLGEIGRRAGIGKSNMARLDGPVTTIFCGSFYSPYLVQMNGGDVQATNDPLPEWDDPVINKPQLVRQDPNCASGGRLTGSANEANIGGFGIILNGTVSLTAGCCYFVRYSININASRSQVGLYHQWFWEMTNLDINAALFNGCGTTSELFAANSDDGNHPGGDTITYTLQKQGYACALTGGVVGSTFTAFALDGGVGRDLYNWNASVDIEFTNIFCDNC